MPTWLAIVLGLIGLASVITGALNWARSARADVVADLQARIVTLERNHTEDQVTIAALRTEVGEWKTKYADLNTDWELKYGALRCELELAVGRRRPGKRLIEPG